MVVVDNPEITFMQMISYFVSTLNNYSWIENNEHFFFTFSVVWYSENLIVISLMFSTSLFIEENIELLKLNISILSVEYWIFQYWILSICKSFALNFKNLWMSKFYPNSFAWTRNRNISKLHFKQLYSNCSVANDALLNQNFITSIFCKIAYIRHL